MVEVFIWDFLIRKSVTLRKLRDEAHSTVDFRVSNQPDMDWAGKGKADGSTCIGSTQIRACWKYTIITTFFYKQ
jgi:hypothetical protein